MISLVSHAEETSPEDDDNMAAATQVICEYLYVYNLLFNACIINWDMIVIMIVICRFNKQTFVGPREKCEETNLRERNVEPLSEPNDTHLELSSL